jgi:hypothetical protein
MTEEEADMTYKHVEGQLVVKEKQNNWDNMKMQYVWVDRDVNLVVLKEGDMNLAGQDRHLDIYDKLGRSLAHTVNPLEGDSHDHIRCPDLDRGGSRKSTVLIDLKAVHYGDIHPFLHFEYSINLDWVAEEDEGGHIWNEEAQRRNGDLVEQNRKLVSRTRTGGVEGPMETTMTKMVVQNIVGMQDRREEVEMKGYLAGEVEEHSDPLLNRGTRTCRTLVTYGAEVVQDYNPAFSKASCPCMFCVKSRIV